MPDELNEVRPGDRITAELINGLIRRVKNPGGGEGTITVPNLFGLNLGVARNSLSREGLSVGTVLDTAGVNVEVNNPANHQRVVLSQVPAEGSFATSGQPVSLTVTEQSSTQAGVQVPDLFGQSLSSAKSLLESADLSASSAYDPFGTPLDLDDAELQSRRVLAQLPAGGSRVQAGTPVRLVLSAEAVAGPTPGTELKITAINPSIAPIRSEVQIFGTNFAADTSDNIVMFNGVRATEPSPQSTTTSLFVVIPDLSISSTVTGLPELAASTEGGAEIVVSVITPNGHSPERKMMVLPPLARNLPILSSVRSLVTSTAQGQRRAIEIQVENAQEWQNRPDMRLYLNGQPGGGLRTQQSIGSFGRYLFILPDSIPGVDIQPGATVLIRLWWDGFLSAAARLQFTL